MQARDHPFLHGYTCANRPNRQYAISSEEAKKDQNTRIALRKTEKENKRKRSNLEGADASSILASIVEFGNIGVRIIATIVDDLGMCGHL